ncbi:TPA: hypothetical protein DCZ39_04970 [Patescibacteria group bacterium]|nr:hypothetical protein [Candidatus Gracilibacteria bacterium]
MIDSNVKKYPKLKNLADELEQQKAYLIGQYEMDLDEYLNNNFQIRYNRSQFMTLQKEINAFKSKYYTSTNQLNCSNIVSTVDASTALLTKINAMKITVNS